MKNRNKLFSLVLIIVAIFALVVLGRNTIFSTDSLGEVTVEVVDLEKNIIKSKDIKFNEGDNILDLIGDNFENFKFQDSEYGPFIEHIESIPAKANSYIMIYVNGEMSPVGIGQIEFKDGTVISLRDEVYNG